MLVVALPGADALSARLAGRLRCEWIPLAVHRFPDGETLVRLDAPVSGRCVVLAGSLDQPDGKTLPLLFAADAARELGAAQVGLVAPYLAYMRQDRRFNAGEAVTSRSYARLLSTCLDFLVTVEPHLHRWHSLGELYPIRTQAVAAAPAIARWVRAHVAQPLLVGPDAESRPWVAQVAVLCEAPFTVLRKTRHGDRDVRVRLTDGGPWPGCTPVLLDDIVSTGHTVLAAAQALRRRGLPAPLCVAVHALFDSAALQELLQGQVARVVSCDTITHPSNAIALSTALVRAVRQLATKAKEAP
ncbi:MAG: ribose-phosphate pyrophosphokinase [Comamonadaceae bacterium]|nr:MAG: ribose-phosphate pyrophosphokinase [Comamonadaceae bacterium]